MRLSQPFPSVHPARTRVGTTLEERARNLLERRAASLEGTPAAVVHDELRLLLDDLDSWRSLHGREMDRLFDWELAVGSQLLDLPPYDSPQCKGVWEFRERARDRLFRLEESRRAQSALYEERVQRLHRELLSALHRHASLIPP